MKSAGGRRRHPPERHRGPPDAGIDSTPIFDFLDRAGSLAEKWGGAALRQRAANRAAAAFVINLSFRRHVAGRTYGRQPTEFNADVDTLEKRAAKAKTTDNAQALREGAISALQTELRKEVAHMKSVVSSTSPGDKQWSDLDEFTNDNKDQKTKLMNEIRTQVLRGQGAIAAQSFSGMEK